MMKLSLCYVTESLAYFTTQSLRFQSGTNWTVIPYEHNAQPPTNQPNNIVIVAWKGPFRLPCDGYENSPYSVNMINESALHYVIDEIDLIPWLRPMVGKIGRCLYPGDSLVEFTIVLEGTGGTVTPNG